MGGPLGLVTAFSLLGSPGLAGPNKKPATLHEAVAQRDVAAVEAFLQAGAALDTRDPEGRTPLHRLVASHTPARRTSPECEDKLPPPVPKERSSTVSIPSTFRYDGSRYKSSGGGGSGYAGYRSAALIAAKMKILDLLLARGAPVHAPDAGGATLLWHAAGGGDREVVERLLGAGADPNARDREGRSPLSETVLGGQVEMVRRLLGAGADPNSRIPPSEPVLVYAASRGNRDLVRELLDRKGDPGAQDGEGRTALHWAACRGDAELVGLLLARKAPVDARTTKDESAMGWALGHGQFDAARALLAAGAGGDPAGSSERTALLSLVLERDLLELAAALLDRGADPNARDTSGRSPLHQARSVAAIKLLVTRGARAEGPPRSPLFEALTLGREDLAEALLEGGAASSLRHPLQDAMDAKNEALFQWFLQRRIGLEGNDLRDRTPLHRAAREGHPERVQALLRAGARVDPRDEFGATPLHYAAQSDWGAVAAVLLDHGANANAKIAEDVVLVDWFGIEKKKLGGSTPFDLAPAGSGTQRLLQQRGGKTAAEVP